ncbi:MAG: DUF1499 domain-containing protein [Desulfobacterales bacterium]|jgi:uncharacterized protein (DUF1499 family)|nr:DUF1499 domain-containing protein [Desulfobacterales bacterium]
MRHPRKSPLLALLMAGAVVHGWGDEGRAEGPNLAAGRLKPCPNSPNCASSLSTDPRHAVDPIVFSGRASEARQKLLSVIRAMPRARIVQAAGDYLHAEFESALLRFVDDVEFLIDEAQNRIQVRSASRAGYWDLGVNRRRVEEIRRRLATGASKEADP